MWSIRRKRLCGISVKSRTHCSRLCSWCSKLPTSCCSAHTGCLHPPHRQWKYSTNTGHQPKEKDSGQNQAVGLFCETQLTTHRLGQRSLAYPFLKKILWPTRCSFREVRAICCGCHQIRESAFTTLAVMCTTFPLVCSGPHAKAPQLKSSLQARRPSLSRLSTRA